ncbi:hypothetical protein [Methylobacterium dankookense]|uniref:Uncharacterized protein n=1 Tax=Methylobacterium dankookense TaxID=560405 RepID=A0A564FY09_9HYPH|nr:hypothetical protein [Methylobacterium dankookense]GJD59073.1 hypothetical protein IFDJLNFL_5000 [Methylobacterium dankookense]VUF13069.1 hypothetical protein MTDSW087_02767 [Methylobacterium dankookense]
MTQSHPTSGAEPDVNCPVSMELLGSVYRADDYDLPEILESIPPLKRAQLAAYLYGKSHMHQLGLKVARACSREDLIRVAGEIGSVIHGQAHLKPASPAPEAAAMPAPKPKPGQKKVSLAGAPKKISLGGPGSKRSFDFD